MRVPRQKQQEHANFKMKYSSAVKSNPQQSESSRVPVQATRTKARKQAVEQYKAIIDIAKQKKGREGEPATSGRERQHHDR